MNPKAISHAIWEHIFRGEIDEAVAISQEARTASNTGLRETASSASALIFDISLSSVSGHQANLVRAYQRLVRQAGYTAAVWHSHIASLAVGSAPEWNPYFLVQHHSLPSAVISNVDDLEHVNRYFQNEYAGVLSQNQPKLCVFSTARYNSIVGAVNAVIQQEYSEQPGLVFTVFESDDAPDCNAPELSKLAFSTAASLLEQHCIQHIVSVETDYIRDYLISCGFEADNVHKYEYVAAQDITRRNTSVTRIDDRIRVGYLGGTRPVKNPELIAQMIVESTDTERVVWCVQLDLVYLQRVLGSEVVEKISKMHERGEIELHAVGLPDDEYRSLFCSLDMVVLPYSERYNKIGSGILAEAIYAEVIPILPDNSSMKKLYASLGGIAPTFSSLSTTELGNAIARGVTSLAELKRSASLVRAAWRGHSSSAMQWHDAMLRWISKLKHDR